VSLLLLAAPIVIASAAADRPARPQESTAAETLIAEAVRGSEVIGLRAVAVNATRHVAWVEQSKNRSTVWLDGTQVGGVYDEVTVLGFRGRPLQLAFVASRQNRSTLVVNGREIGSGYTKITAPDIGPNGEVLAGVCFERACRLTLDGRDAGPTFEDISAPDFSPTLEHHVYFGMRAKKWVAILDAAEIGPPMEARAAFRWWPSAARIAVAARVGDKYTWIVDGKPGPLFDVIGNIAISPSGDHYAYGGANAAGGFKEQDVVGSVVVDGTVREPTYTGKGIAGSWTYLFGTGRSIAKGLRSLSADFHGVSDPVFIGRNELLFARRLGDGHVVVGDDESAPRFEDVVSDIAVSSDGEHVAYVGKEGNAFVEVRDGKPGARMPIAREVAFVPWTVITPSGRLAYEVAQGGSEFKAGRTRRALRRVMLDGIAGREYDALGIVCRLDDAERPPACVVVGAEGNRDRLIVNGLESRLYDEIVPGSVAFLSSTTVEFIARQERRILRVTMELDW
jgi:hypothetical protein